MKGSDKMAVQYQAKIGINDVKNGELVQFTDNPKKTYLKVAHGQTIHFIPIDLSNAIKIGMYDLNQPAILNVFNNKGKLRLSSKNDE